MSPIVPNGKATRSMSLAPPLESQDVSRYQAENPDPMIFGPVNPPLAWRHALPFFVLGVVWCVSLFLPWPVQLGVAVGTVVAGLAALLRIL